MFFSLTPPRSLLLECKCEDEEEVLGLVATSGRPFSAIDVRVLDAEGCDLMPDGIEVGEVVVRGPTVFDGYWGDESHLDEGWFRTGDLATVSNPYLSLLLSLSLRSADHQTLSLFSEPQNFL